MEINTLVTLKEIKDIIVKRNTTYSKILTFTWQSQYDADAKTARFTSNISPNIYLESLNYSVALIGIQTFYSFPNVSSGINNIFRWSKDGAAYQNIEIPTGSYALDNIIKYITDALKPDGNIILSGDLNTLKCKIKISGAYTVDFTYANSINTILGFNSEILTAGNNIGENIVNILNINSIFVNCDFITANYNNNRLQSSIYVFFPDVAPGYKIVENITNPIYIPINKTDITDATVWLSDQDGNLIDFRGELITLTFHIKSM
jgi:hypothetical protein